MSDILNEHEADQAVISSLVSHIAQIKGENMHDVILFKDDDGNIKRAHNFENVSRDDITDQIKELSDDLSKWQNALVEFDQLNQADQAAAPAPEAPVQAPEPSVAALSGTSELQPVELTVIPAADANASNASVDTSVQPEAPAPQVIEDVTAPAPILQ